MYCLVGLIFHKLQSQTFVAVSVTWKTLWAVSWDVPVKVSFKACVWLLNYFKSLITTFRNAKLLEPSPLSSLGLFRVCRKTTSSLLLNLLCFSVGACHAISTKMRCPKHFWLWLCFLGNVNPSNFIKIGHSIHVFLDKIKLMFRCTKHLLAGTIKTKISWILNKNLKFCTFFPCFVSCMTYHPSKFNLINIIYIIYIFLFSY